MKVVRVTLDNWIVLGILIAVIATATILVYLPQGRTLDQIRAQTASNKLALESNSVKAAVVPQLVKQLEAMKRRYRGFDRRMPKRKELAGFLKEISSILAAEDLKILNTEPRSPKQEDLFHTLPIIMKLEGPYLSLAKLLGQIDKMERLTRIQRLSVSKDPKKDTQDLNIELQMNIYFTET
jgi:Tfp pilus assembly protein PilO